MLLSLFGVDRILVWLAEKLGLIGALSVLRFKQLIADNPGIVVRFRRLQAEADANMAKEASGSEKLHWVVESVLSEMKETANDGLRALLYGFSTVLWAEMTTPTVKQQPELPPVNMPIS